MDVNFTFDLCVTLNFTPGSQISKNIERLLYREHLNQFVGEIRSLLREILVAGK